MPRAIWKGAISFGLVHVPVALFPASQEGGVDFDWLDRRSMDPVGYKRINKRTGKEVASEDIVRGIRQDSGEYVILSEDEIKAAYPRATQTIEIETFVKAEEIPFFYLEKPYFLGPIGKGDKVYALLREVMKELSVIGVARVVMHSRERLAVLVPNGASLMLNTIRWSAELRSSADAKVPASGKSAVSLKEGELKMARQLVADMTHKWKPDEYADQFTAAIHALAARRAKAGKTSQVTSLETEDDTAPKRSNVIDLTELLRQSLRGHRSGNQNAPRLKSRKATSPRKSKKSATKATAARSTAKAPQRAVKRAA